MRREIALLHAKTNIHRRRVLSATEIISSAIEQCDAWYVSFSGGKDSTVVAALVREQLPDVPLIWSDDEWWFPETAEYMGRIKNLHQIRTKAWHAEWFQIEGDFSGIPEYARLRGRNGAFIGLRQEESGPRKIYLRTYGPLHYVKSNQQWQCNPIHNWTWMDVWAYIYSNDLTYNLAYDKLEEIGIPPARQRIGPLAVDRVLGYGQIVILKRGWPDLYNKFVARYPDASLYT